MNDIIGIRGGGDIATGVAWRLHKCGFRVYIMEIERPLMVRRTVCFAQAVIDNEATIEGVTAKMEAKSSLEGFEKLWCENIIPIIIDPNGASIEIIKPTAVVDAILAKKNLGTKKEMAKITIGLGPGFTAGEDVSYIVETKRGHYLGKVIDKGAAIPDTGIPENVLGYTSERVLRAPESGIFFSDKNIGESVLSGEVIGNIINNGIDDPVFASINGVLRGLIADGTEVPKGMKIADIDPRNDNKYCCSISDKARAVGGGVLEAIMRGLSAETCQ